MAEASQFDSIQPIQIAPNLVAPTLDERTMAILAHVLQIVGLWIAPLIIFVIRRESRYVSFHALQALLLQALYLFLMVVGAFFFFAAVIFAAAASHASGVAPPPPLFLLVPMLWLDWLGLWAAMVVAAIVYGVKAGRGEWAEYPYLGRLARKILKMGPDGAPL
jgi:uncharacterized membrane protein